MKKTNVFALSCLALSVVSGISHAGEKVFTNRNFAKSSTELLGSSKVNVIVKTKVNYQDKCSYNSVGCTLGTILGSATASADLQLWKLRRKDIAKASVENLHQVTPKVYLKNSNQLFMGYTLNKNRISAIAKDWNGKVVWDKHYAGGEGTEMGTIFHLNGLVPFLNAVDSAKSTSKSARQCFTEQVNANFRKELQSNRSSWYKPIQGGQFRYSNRIFYDAVKQTISKCAPSVSFKNEYFDIVRDLHQQVLSPFSISGQKNQTFYAQFSGDSELSDWDINTRFNIKVDYGYQASYNVVPYSRYSDATFTPFLNSSFDAVAEYGDYSVEGSANPLLNASLKAHAYFQQSEMGGYARGTWRGPEGKVEACYSILCLEVWDINSTQKSKLIWSHDED